ncbi:hypothetical protein M2318_002593 [Metapseudomonas resinovorans]|uniref:hypothetical protein n=1 Tax=Metapseudomonas resinovorans TaxID=53412 RepID=UPI003D213C28
MHMLKPALLSLAVAGTSHAALAAEDLGNLFTQGKPILDARYRYENVEQDNNLRNANAQTLRTRVGFQSGKWYGLSGLVEVDNVSRLGDAEPLAGGSLQAWYHDFETERNGDSYGSEIDLSYAHPIPGVKGLVGLIKYAAYDSDDRSRTVDTDKFWLQAQYSY